MLTFSSKGSIAESGQDFCRMKKPTSFKGFSTRRERTIERCDDRRVRSKSRYVHCSARIESEKSLPGGATTGLTAAGPPVAHETGGNPTSSPDCHNERVISEFTARAQP